MSEPGAAPEAREDRGRVLGLDVGDRRIGVAISDPEGRFAVPLRSLERDKGGVELQELARLAAAEEVKEIVVGLPLSLSGAAGVQAEATRAFARRLQESTSLPVHFWDERLSTQEALRRLQARREGRGRRRREAAADTDALAASIILQAYLDSRRASEWASAAPKPG